MSARLAPVAGEWIDRRQPLAFTFEGRPYLGYAGDVITSALAAAGVGTLGRSFKYHRRRGVLSAANHDANALVTDGFHINLRADVTPLRAGMNLRAVNTFGGLARDYAQVLDTLAPLLPVGFYYKAFHKPKWAAPWWERLFRRMSGLGAIRAQAPREPVPNRSAHCDVLVVGAGAAGLNAAIAAARAGAEVVLVDENAQAGGSLGYACGGSDDSRDAARRLIGEAAGFSNLTLCTATTAVGYYADHWVALVDPVRLTRMRARAVVVTSGVFEQPAVFRGNDVPGVMLASAAQRLIYRYAVRPLRRVVVLTANREGYGATLDLLAHGADIAALVDLRADGEPDPIADAVRAAGIGVRNGECIVEAGRRGTGLAYVVLGSAAVPERRTARLECDGALMSVGFAPAANLLHQAGTRMCYDTTIEQFRPQHLPDGVFAAGRVNGVYDLEAKCLDGQRAGRAAARHAGYAAEPLPAPPATTRTPSHPYPIVAHGRGKNFVDFDEDIQLDDLLRGAREGYDHIELLKRYTTVGMGPSQGKHSNMNAVRILARERGESPDQIGTTTARPFYQPVPMAVLAGRGLHPQRRTALHDLHTAAGAVWMPSGDWQRPAYYRSAADAAACIAAEAARVRQTVGLIDVSTLGKFEVFGPDAVTLLERVYTGRYADLKVGMSRYALMLDEAAVVIDDGVIARLGLEHFYFTTTTTGATLVHREITRRAIEWGLEVGIVNLTGARAAMNLAGPHSRTVLARVTDLDLSAAALPFQGIREASLAGVPARLIRVGFVGELGYEIHCAAEHAAHVWNALSEAGAESGIGPFGVEAQRLLRLEKGHPIIGQDTDGLTTPLEAGLEKLLKDDKPFFIGQRSARILAREPPRRRLVGFTVEDDGSGASIKECHLVIRAGEIAGRVTSIARSATLQRHVGMAYVPADCAQPGASFTLRASDARLVQARVTSMPFYDPLGARQRLDGTRAAPLSLAARAVRRSAMHGSTFAPGSTAGLHAGMPIDRGRGPASAPAAIRIADVSALPRLGVKGTRAAAWLAAHGVPVPEAANRWCAHGDGIVARLGRSEFLLAAGPASGDFAALHAALEPAAGRYPVLRQDAAFALAGARVPELLAQFCSHDFTPGRGDAASVVMTHVAEISATVLWHAPSATTRIWCDYSYGPYLWQVLTQAAAEFGGGAVPLHACLGLTLS